MRLVEFDHLHNAQWLESEFTVSREKMKASIALVARIVLVLVALQAVQCHIHAHVGSPSDSSCLVSSYL